MLKDIVLSELLQKYVKEETVEVNTMLTPFIEKNNITLLYAESGVGKTVFMIEHLNKSGIVPLLIDFDGNKQSHFKPLGLNLKTHILDGEQFMLDIFKNDNLRKDLQGYTIIIDTWRKLVEFYKTKTTNITTEAEALKRLESLLKYIPNLTIVIIAHANCFANKEDMPDMDSEVYSHINGRLNIKKHTTTSKRTFTLFIDKVRGYTGDNIILLREESLKKNK